MLKPTIKKLKNLRGKITGYRARYGVQQAEGETAKAAALNVETAVLNALMRLDRGTHIGVWRGHTYVIAPDGDGWRYWIDTFSRTDYWCMTNGTRDEVQDIAMRGLAQTTWTREVEDDVAFVEGLSYPVRRELVTYFNWQRAYAVARDKGETDESARAFADTVQRHSAPVQVPA